MPPLHERLADARRALVQAGIHPDEAAIDVEILARHLLGWDRARFIVAYRDAVPTALEAGFDALLRRRVAREPVAYITGRREFWGRDFEVTPAVLVPRPETEIIVEEALAASHGGLAVETIVDVGTGSGCLAVTLALECPNARVFATDVSGAALDVARANAARLGARVTFIECDLLEQFTGHADLIVSNPPYVRVSDQSHMPPEVVRYEPHTALFGGEDGLAVIRRLFGTAPSRVAEGGLLVVEFGYGQERAVRDAAGTAGWRLEAIRNDLQGVPRTAVLRR